jgi:molybdate transport system substrate-binding protein
MLLNRWLCLLLTCFLAGTAQGERIDVAVASNFMAPIKELSREFERDSGHNVRLSFGSSGKFYAQIRHGAPFLVFFSADQAKPQALESAGLTVPGSRFTYAIGTLVLWSAKPGFLTNGQERLASGEFNRLALANPRLAPYGVAAIEVLESLKLTAATRPKWVQGENISQTYQFVSTGNADIGFVALSQLQGDSSFRDSNGLKASGSSWKVPQTLHRPIRQDAVLLKRGEYSPAARALLEFIRSEKAGAIIVRQGYLLP